MSRETAVKSHPLDPLLRADRLPHIWCPGCGLGSIMACLSSAIAASSIPAEKHVIVSGIGCTGRVAGYMKLDSFHTTHGRAIPFATGLKLANPELEVTVVSGDGDLFAIGGNHFIHAARRNIDINVVCVNNFNYGMTGGQAGPTTPVGARTSTTPQGATEPTFNLPLLAATLGAVFVARWTSLHVRQLEKAMSRVMEKDGFSFIEVLSPCPVGFGKSNDIGDGLDEMSMYRRNGVVSHDADLTEAGIDMKHDSPIVLGNFRDVERPALGVRQ
ncbi:MAG: 2-oxoacid:ferredoxin oxidoreductase subunit beta [Dehalococcoidia bacterium]|nr:2-oxoacid:ferredoxin oxidoreductase subunit beta [Dehalococcoidia bacterium]